VRAIVKELQQSGGSFKDVDDARAKIEKLQAGVTAELGGEEVEERESDEICEGDTVMLLDIGSEGVVLQAPAKNGDVQVREASQGFVRPFKGS
jgi:hypothetical protein